MRHCHSPGESRSRNNGHCSSAPFSDRLTLMISMVGTHSYSAFIIDSHSRSLFLSRSLSFFLSPSLSLSISLSPSIISALPSCGDSCIDDDHDEIGSAALGFSLDLISDFSWGISIILFLRHGYCEVESGELVKLQLVPVKRPLCPGFETHLKHFFADGWFHIRWWDRKASFNKHRRGFFMELTSRFYIRFNIFSHYLGWDPLTLKDDQERRSCKGFLNRFSMDLRSDFY